MIRRIRGTVLEITEKSAVVDVGGVGYEVYLPTGAISGLRLGELATLETRLIIREDAHELYGFADKSELEFFELLLGVSGVGPKSALTIVSIGSINTLKKAIGSGDLSYLTKVSGIGKKTAEKIIVELRDKLALMGHNAREGELSGESDALEALLALGYSREEARDALKDVPALFSETSGRVREALKILGKK